MAGTLYIVSTPIGNMEDITLRALRILREVGTIASEDTRRTGRLLAHHKIPKKHLVSFNDKNKRRRLPRVISELKGGSDVALVSDAGTPGISDPAFTLVRSCVQEDISVVPIPGASASLAALVGSSLPTDQFRFVGFLPKKKGQRKSLLAELAEDEGTVICFESVYRIASTLELMAEVMPDHQVVVARELTKLHEEFLRGTVREVATATQEKKWKGEVVVLFHKPT